MKPSSKQLSHHGSQSKILKPLKSTILSGGRDTVQHTFLTELNIENKSILKKPSSTKATLKPVWSADDLRKTFRNTLSPTASRLMNENLNMNPSVKKLQQNIMGKKERPSTYSCVKSKFKSKPTSKVFKGGDYYEWVKREQESINEYYKNDLQPYMEGQVSIINKPVPGKGLINLKQKPMSEMEEKIRVQKNVLSKLNYEYETRQNYLQQLQSKYKQIEKFLDTSHFEEHYEKLEDKVDELVEKVNKENMQSKTYKHMVENIQGEILEKQDPKEKMLKDIKTVDKTIDRLVHMRDHDFTDVNNWNKEMWNIATAEEDQDKHRMLKMGDASKKMWNLTYFKETWDYVNKREDREAEERKHRKDERFEKEKDLMSLQNKHLKTQAEEKEEELKEFVETLNKISRVSKSESVSDFIKHYNTLGTIKMSLEEIQEQLIEKIKEDQTSVETKEEQLNKLVLAKEEDKHREHYLGQLESDYYSKEQQKQDMEEQLKKAEDTFARIVNVVSRVGTQINRHENSKEGEEGSKIRGKKSGVSKKKGNFTVSKQNVYKNLIHCGLRLERMVAILSQKNQIFPIESINTDYTIVAPPAYIGIKNVVRLYERKKEKTVKDEPQQTKEMEKEKDFKLEEEYTDEVRKLIKDPYVKQEEKKKELDLLGDEKPEQQQVQAEVVPGGSSKWKTKDYNQEQLKKMAQKRTDKFLVGKMDLNSEKTLRQSLQEISGLGRKVLPPIGSAEPTENEKADKKGARRKTSWKKKIIN